VGHLFRKPHGQKGMGGFGGAGPAGRTRGKRYPLLIQGQDQGFPPDARERDVQGIGQPFFRMPVQSGPGKDSADSRPEVVTQSPDSGAHVTQTLGGQIGGHPYPHQAWSVFGAGPFAAFLAAAVVGLFEGTIAKYTALAVLLPVVAGQSGNTGAQALAVTMRGLALREIRVQQWPRIVFKEMSAGFWNGIAVAATTSLGVWVWSGSAGLAGIIGVSMILSMVIAGIFGAAIPLVLTAIGQDPAQSSTIVLTTITDVTGFFSFLGIATLFSGLL